MSYRIEKDTLGEMQVPAEKLWAAQTQRSVENFPIGDERMPKEVVQAFAYLKKSVAITNHKLEKLEQEKMDAISKACDEVLEKKHEEEFPLVVWQTGSGTQSNMNMNEVVANRATQILGGDFTKEKLVHPNDHVNMSQSSNDTFPTAMHVAAVIAVEEELLPSLQHLTKILKDKQDAFKDIVKIGRTHLQDATPLTLGQEFSGYVSMLEHNLDQIQQSLPHLRELAIGGTAVGTGLNAHPKLSEMVSETLTTLTGHKFISSPNKFHALTAHDPIVVAHGALKALAANLMKIANDIRWLGSGPRCGIGELELPANEPGSSIMPGKVNPTQTEAITMVSCQVLGNDTAIGVASSQGNFELNVFKPVIIYNFLQSLTLLKDSMRAFADKCVVGIKPVENKIKENLQNSLMLVTALNPHIGYENAAKIAKTAFQNNTTLKEEAVKSGLLTEEEFDKYVIPENMV